MWVMMGLTNGSLDERTAFMWPDGTRGREHEIVRFGWAIYGIFFCLHSFLLLLFASRSILKNLIGRTFWWKISGFWGEISPDFHTGYGRGRLEYRLLGSKALFSQFFLGIFERNQKNATIFVR
jgi:hypothetical protein